MPRPQFGLSSYERARGGLPSLPVYNLYVERAPTEETGVALQSRPGLETAGITLGDGPVRALFRRDGVLSGALFGVSGGSLYSGATALGAVDGAGPFSMAGYEDYLFVAGGGSLWGWNGTTFQAVAFPDDAPVSKVVIGASRALCLRADTEKFYWSDPLSTTIDALSFASAESQPDRLRDVLFIDDTAVLFGAETVEFWPNTGDAELPFRPLEGRVFEVGVRNTGAAVEFGPAFAWVTNFNRVCVGDETSVISNEGLELKIADSEACRLWTFYVDSTEFLALTLDDETHVYSSASRMWSRFGSGNLGQWAVGCYAAGLFGSATDGIISRFSNGWQDFGSTLTRLFRFGLPFTSGAVAINNLLLRANVGTTGFVTGTYAEPVVELRTSRTAGRTWGAWRQRSLGAQGEYRKKVQWLGLGTFGQPGMMGEMRVSDPVDWRVSDVLVNEVYNGL